MINNIEISPSDRAICKYCGKKIGIGTPRGVRIEDGGQYQKCSYYCYKCTSIEIEEMIKFQKDVKKELKELIKKHTKEIILMELETEKEKK